MDIMSEIPPISDMALLPTDQKLVDDFFATIEPSRSAYQHVGFSYLAIKFGESYQIIRGRVFLNTAPPNATLPHFSSPHVRAGHYSLNELGFRVRPFLNQLMTGVIETPDGPLLFTPASGGRYGASFIPLHPDGLSTQARFAVLTLMAGATDHIRQPEIDWEIKAASRPYEGLQELANEFSLGPLVQRPSYVEFVAYNVAVVDAQTSKVDGTRAEIGIRVAKGLERSGVRLAYRIYAPGSPTIRSVASADEMAWSEDSHFDRARLILQLPLASALNCTVSYAGNAHHHFWLSDPNRVPNPRRAAYEAFDPKLEQVSAIVANAQGRGEDARDLESSVAWLLWMLGFSAAHLNVRRMRDASDLIVSTPQGHFAIVECTTGLLKAENKLSILHDRASKTRAEIAPDVEAAERLGILVMTRENLDDAITQRTVLPPNADQIYAEAEQIVSEALAKHQVQQTLPLDLPPNAS
jgi:hypothetical protein